MIRIRFRTTVATAAALLACLGPMQTRSAVAQARQRPGANSAATEKSDPGASIYKSQCAACHQADRSGSAPEYPSLIGVGKRFTDQELTDAITQGLPRMLAFPNLTDSQVAALVKFLRAGDAPPAK